MTVISEQTLYVKHMHIQEEPKRQAVQFSLTTWHRVYFSIFRFEEEEERRKERKKNIRNYTGE